MPYLIAAPFILTGLGFFADKTGEGIDHAANGLLKLAVAGGVGFYLLKKTKVI